MKTTEQPLELLTGVDLLLAGRERGVSEHGIELMQHRHGLQRERMFGGSHQQFHLRRLRELAATLLSPVTTTNQEFHAIPSGSVIIQNMERAQVR